MGNNELDLPSAISCGLDCHLGILKLFFLHKHTKLFTIDFSSLVRENVVRWSEQLAESKHYLQLLVNAVNNEKIAYILKESIKEMPKKDIFFNRLVGNIVKNQG
jgi:hypothetical protein